MTGVRSQISRLSIVIASLLAACGGDDLVLPGDGSMAIQVVDGDGQNGSVGELLTAPVVVQVTDASGDPVEGVTVNFALTSAGQGAEISPATARTGADGRAGAHILLGDKVGLQTGEARVAGDGASLPVVTFSALAAAAPPAPPPSNNESPQADFEVHCDHLSCAFSDASKDDDGSIVTRHWDFGDGAASSQRNPTHSYGTPGGYQVRLTVTDNDGATDTRARTAEPKAAPPPPPPPPPSNKPPHADFHVHCHDGACSFEDRSNDDDGTIVSWSWSFGDGDTSGDRSPVHTYPDKGHYDASLTVTDDDGASNTKTARIDIKGH